MTTPIRHPRATEERARTKPILALPCAYSLNLPERLSDGSPLGSAKGYGKVFSPSSTFRNYTQSEPRFRALLAEGATKLTLV